MKIYFLNPPYFLHFGRGARWQDTGRAGTLYYPIWLSYAVAQLDSDHNLRFVDAPAWNWDETKVLDDITSFNPDVLIFDSSFPSLKNDLKIAKDIRNSLPTTIIILVGPPASIYSDRILSSGAVDVSARYEYDFTLKELVIELEKNHFKTSDVFPHIHGISYVLDGEIFHNQDRAFSSSEMLDTVPFVAKIYKKYLSINDYFLGQSINPEVQIFTGRGCPNNCSFCAWPQTLSGKCYRVRNIQNVLDEVEWIEKNLIGVNEVFMEDDTFTINKNRVIEFCEGYIKRGLKIAWACNARANTLDLETMKLMKKAHCRLLIGGFESGSEDILKAIKKGITLEQIRTYCKNARKAGLMVQADFIVGLPGETKETIQETRKLIKEINTELLQVAVASPFPGTDFYNWCKNHDYLLTDNPDEYLDSNGHQKAIISYPELSNEEMVSEVNKILHDNYVTIRYIPKVLRQIFRRNGIHELKRIFFSAKMFLNNNSEQY